MTGKYRFRVPTTSSGAYLYRTTVAATRSKARAVSAKRSLIVAMPASTDAD